MINCEEAARIVSEMKDRKVPLLQRGQMWFHLALCAMCRTYRRQLDMISQLSQRAGNAVMHSDGAPALSEGCKQRIKKNLTS